MASVQRAWSLLRAAGVMPGRQQEVGIPGRDVHCFVLAGVGI